MDSYKFSCKILAVFRLIAPFSLRFVHALPRTSWLAREGSRHLFFAWLGSG